MESFPKPPPLPSQRRAKVAPEPAGSERREFRRVALDVEVGFFGPDNFYSGFSEDISEGGLFVSTYELLPTGTELDVKFTLPEGSQVEAKAVVRWVREPRNEAPDVAPGMGLQFTTLTEDQRNLVNYFISKREPLFYDE